MINQRWSVADIIFKNIFNINHDIIRYENYSNNTKVALDESNRNLHDHH
jgi:hypothetical protein